MYDYILFYRWLSPDGEYERGRVMARLVTEMIEKKSRRIWLDQREMKRTLSPGHVVGRITETFFQASQVIILAAPGDWNRFMNEDDIHRWEWELSLQSGKDSFPIGRGEPSAENETSEKQVWVLQYGLAEHITPLSKEELVVGLGSYNARLAELARHKNLQMRALSMDNIDGVLGEIVNAT